MRFNKFYHVIYDGVHTGIMSVLQQVMLQKIWSMAKGYAELQNASTSRINTIFP